jgi:hypothetical protein
MSEHKRAAIASSLMVHIQRVPLSEVAICLGQSDGSTHDAHFMFVYSTKKVVLRRRFTRLGNIIPDFCTPNIRPNTLMNPSLHLRPLSPSPVGEQLQHVQPESVLKPTPALFHAVRTLISMKYLSMLCHLFRFQL